MPGALWSPAASHTELSGTVYEATTDIKECQKTGRSRSVGTEVKKEKARAVIEPWQPSMTTQRLIRQYNMSKTSVLVKLDLGLRSLVKRQSQLRGAEACGSRTVPQPLCVWLSMHMKVYTELTLSTAAPEPDTDYGPRGM